MQPLSWYPDDKQVRASGSLKASARDLEGWLRLNLNAGEVGGKRIVSAKALAELHTPQMVMPLERDLAKLSGTTQESYGLGWRIFDCRGHRVLHHGGANDGFRAHIALGPKEKLGLVVLSNLEEMGLVRALGRMLLDELLGLEKKGHLRPV